MGLDVQQLGLYVVRPTLAALAAAVPGIDSPVAEALLLGTAAQESQFRFLHQQGGPALGLWQMEPMTEKYLWDWIGERPSLREVFVQLAGGGKGSVLDLGSPALIWNLRYACAMARLLYWRDPEPLPVIDLAGDSFGQAAVPFKLWPTYKRIWNTDKGKATRAAFLKNYADLVAPVAQHLWL